MNEYALTQQKDDYERMEAAIRFLEANYRRRPSLDEMAASVHLSKFHFQRLFKRWAGVTPSQFVQFLSLQYAKERLAESASVLDAALDTGLSGPGRLHDLFVTFEAMTPGEYRSEGAGLRIEYGFHDTPFGECMLAATPRGICTLSFVGDGGRADALEPLDAGWPLAGREEAPGKTRPLVDQIFTPATGGAKHPFHLLLRGTNFQVQVWQALLTIPPGALVSYQDVAACLGNPKASRAVASAIARNPISYLIPCHRVIRKSGGMHKYRWGSARKKALIGWEASRRAAGERAA